MTTLEHQCTYDAGKRTKLNARCKRCQPSSPVQTPDCPILFIHLSPVNQYSSSMKAHEVYLHLDHRNILVCIYTYHYIIQLVLLQLSTIFMNAMQLPACFQDTYERYLPISLALFWNNAAESLDFDPSWQPGRCTSKPLSPMALPYRSSNCSERLEEATSTCIG